MYVMQFDVMLFVGSIEIYIYNILLLYESIYIYK